MTSVTITRDNDIAVVTFDRGGKANAMTFAIMDELAEAARGFERDNDARAVILTGTAKIFSAGMDLTQPVFDVLAEMSLAEKRALAEHGPRLARSWAAIEAPTITAVDGPCLAGGFALAAMTDFRVAGEGARFGAPEVAVAHNMGWHSVPRLVRLVGVSATRRILIAGEEWNAAEAEALGFADAIASAGQALERAQALAARISGYPSMAARMIKRQIDAAAHGPDYGASAFDKDQQIVAWTSREFAEARAAFMKK